MGAVVVRASERLAHVGRFRRARQPDSCSEAGSSSSASTPASRSSQRSIPGSTEPDRVAITSPSFGVKPIVVSTERPPRTAASDAPAPRWQVTSRSADGGRPSSSRRAPGGPRVAGGRGSRSAASPKRSIQSAGQRVQRGRGRGCRVKGGVEAGDGRQGRARGRTAAMPPSARPVQRSERPERADARLDARIEQHRPGVPRAAVHDAVPDSVGLRQFGERHSDRVRIDRPVEQLQVMAGADRERAVEHAQLQRARARVDDEHAHACDASSRGAANGRLLRYVRRRSAEPPCVRKQAQDPLRR